MPTQTMSRLRRVSSVTVVGLGIVLASPKAIGQEKDCCDARRQYYLSSETVMGGEVGRVCRAGFHMASLWEILDTSNLKYASDFGVKILDQGAGPPAGIWGWVRTGWTTTSGSTEGSSTPGQAHCFLWGHSTDDYRGTRVRLTNDWRREFRNMPIAPWEADARKCNNREHVWCVQD